MDAEKENDNEESKEDTGKELDVDDTSNAENISNPADESEENSETTDLNESERNLDVETVEDDTAEQVPSKNNQDTLVLVKKNEISQEENHTKADDIKQREIVKNPPKGNQKEETVNGKKKVREGKPFTKIVIRRLPPTMTKEVFLDQVSPLPPFDYFYFVPAYTGGFSRAYINFINQNDLFDFTRTFDNYVFIDSKGHEYPAIVEFAPYQRVPKARPGRKKDHSTGSLETDPVYVTFKEQLQAEELENSRTTNKQHYFETEINESEEVVTTPLLEFLKVRRAEKDRIREERREDRKRKEAERKLLKQKIKDKPQEDETEIKISEELIHSFKTEETTSVSEEEDDEVLPGGKVFDEKPIIKAILVKPKNKSEIEESLNDKPDQIVDNIDPCQKFDNILENTDCEKLLEDSLLTSDDQDKPKNYFQNKTYREDWEHREPGDMYRFSKARYWERQVKGGNSSYRYRRSNRVNMSCQDHENYCDYPSSYSLNNSSVLQPPKEKKEFTKDKDAKRAKHKEKEDRFIKPESRSREFKNKGGKSYREERLKQAEKREEKKKKESEEDKEIKDEVAIDEEIKEEEKFWADKKKWKYGGSGDSKGRTFTRRRDEKRKEIFDKKRGTGKPHRTRKGSGESNDENIKKENSSESSEKTLVAVPTEKSDDKNSLNSPRKEKESTFKQEDSNTKEKINTAQKSTKENARDKNEEKENQNKENKKKEKENVPSAEVNKKDRLQKESSIDSEEGGKPSKDPRAERRIRNKDRPSIEIYRPGMGKFSRQRLEKEKTLGSTDESPSHSPSPTPNNSNQIN